MGGCPSAPRASSLKPSDRAIVFAIELAKEEARQQNRVTAAIAEWGEFAR